MKIKYEKIIIILFTLVPIVDIFNGVISLNAIDASLGIIYKFLICLIMLIILLKRGRFNRTYLFAFIATLCYCVFSISVNLLFLNTVNVKIEFFVKLMFNLGLYVLLNQYMNNGYIFIHTINKIFDNNVWILSAGFLIPYILGLGNSTYSGELGYKGFYISQNEISLVIIILFYYCLEKISTDLKLKNFIQIILIMCCGLLLNTKSCLIAIGIGIFFLIFNQIFNEDKKTRYMMAFFCVIGIFVMKDMVLESLSTVFLRFYYINITYSDGFLNAVLSGRTYLLKAGWEYLISNYTFLRFFIGNGFTAGMLVEMDFIDLFYFLGFIGVLVTLIFLCVVVKKCRFSLNGVNEKIRVIACIIIFLFMFFTGHGIFMATSGVYVVLYLVYNRRDKNSKTIIE